MYLPEFFPMTQVFLLFGTAITTLAALTALLEGARFLGSRWRSRAARAGRARAPRRAAPAARAGRGS